MKELQQEELIYNNYDDSRLKQLAQPKSYRDNSKLQYSIKGDPQTTIRPISKKALTYTPSKRFLELACPKWPYFIYNGTETFRFIERDRLASPEDRAFGPEEVLGLMPPLKQIEVTRPSAVTFIPFWQSKKRKEPRLITFRTTVEETKTPCPKRINTLALPRRNNMEDRKKEIEKANKIYSVSKSALEAVPSPRILALAKPKVDKYLEVKSRTFVVSKPLSQKEKIQRDEKRTTRREKTKEINDYMLLFDKTKFLDKTKHRKSSVSGIKQVKQLEREMKLDTVIKPSETHVKQPVKPIAKTSKKLSASKYSVVSTQAQKANKDSDKESMIKKDVKIAKTKKYKKEVQVTPRKSSQLPPSVSKLSITASSSNKSLLEDTEIEDEREGKEIKPKDKKRETKDREIKHKREEKEMKPASTSRKVSVKLYPIASKQEQKVDKDLGKQEAMKKDMKLTAAKTIKRKKEIRDASHVIPSKSSQVPLSVSKLSATSTSSDMSLLKIEFEIQSAAEEFTIEKLKLEEVQEQSLEEVSLTSLSEAITEITENLDETDIDVKDKEKELLVSAVIDESKNGTTKNGDSIRDKLQLHGKDTEITKVEQTELTKRIEDLKNSTFLSITTESNMNKVDEGKQIVLSNDESKSIPSIEAEDTILMIEPQFPTEICLEALPETELLKSNERKEVEEETEDMGIGIGSPYEKPLSVMQDLAIQEQKQLPGKQYESLKLKKEYTEDKVKTAGMAKETKFEKKSPPENDTFEEKVKLEVQEEYLALKGEEIEDSATKDEVPLKDTKSIEEELQMPEEKIIEAVKDISFLDRSTQQKGDTLSILSTGKTKSIGLEKDKIIRKQDIETIPDSKEEEKMIRENGMHFGESGVRETLKCMKLESRVQPLDKTKDTTITAGESEYKDNRQKAKEPTAKSNQHETHNLTNSKNLFMCPTLSSLCSQRKELFNKIKNLPFQKIETTKDDSGQNDIGLNIEAMSENQDIAQMTEDEITEHKKRNIREIKQKETGNGKLSKSKYLIGATKRDSAERLIEEKLDTSPIAKALFEAIQLQNIIIRQAPFTGRELAIANMRMKQGQIAREMFIKNEKFDKIGEEKQKASSDISLGSKSQSTTDVKPLRENEMHFGDSGFGESQKCMELDSRVQPLHVTKDTTSTTRECEYKDSRQKAKEPNAKSTQHETHNLINSKNLFVCPTLSSLCAQRKELFNKIKHLPFQKIGTTKDVSGQNDIGLNIEALNENQDIVQMTEDEITEDKKINVRKIKQKESGKLSKLKYLIGATKRDSAEMLIQEKLDTSPIAKALFEAIQLQNIIIRQAPFTGRELAVANMRMKQGQIAREMFIKNEKFDKIGEEKQKTCDISLGSKSQSTTDEEKNKKSDETLDKDAKKEISSATNETFTSITVDEKNTYSFVKETENVSTIGENINAEKISVKEKNKIKDTSVISIESDSSSDQGLRKVTEEASLEISLTKKYIRRLSTIRRLSYLTPPPRTIPVNVSSSKFLLATAEDSTTLL